MMEAGLTSIAYALLNALPHLIIVLGIVMQLVVMGSAVFAPDTRGERLIRASAMGGAILIFACAKIANACSG